MPDSSFPPPMALRLLGWRAGFLMGLSFGVMAIALASAVADIFNGWVTFGLVALTFVLSVWGLVADEQAGVYAQSLIDKERIDA